MKTKRKIAFIITLILAVVNFILETYFLYGYTHRFSHLIKGKPNVEGEITEYAHLNRYYMYLILIFFVLALITAIAAALIAGAPRRRSALIGGLFGAFLPLFGVILNWYRMNIYNSSRITARAMKDVFYNNAGWFWLVFTVLVAIIGVIVVFFTEQRDFSQIGRSDKNIAMKAGILGSLNASGYDINEVIITKEDRKNIMILFYENEEKLDNAEESGETAYIKEICSKMAPGYEVRFEADI